MCPPYKKRLIFVLSSPNPNHSSEIRALLLAFQGRPIHFSFLVTLIWLLHLFGPILQYSRNKCRQKVNDIPQNRSNSHFFRPKLAQRFNFSHVSRRPPLKSRTSASLVPKLKTVSHHVLGRRLAEMLRVCVLFSKQETTNMFSQKNTTKSVISALFFELSSICSRLPFIFWAVDLPPT